MEIKYWSDIACPFCYIGSTRMKKALKELNLYDETPLEFKSFQLDPTSPTTTDETMVEHFSSGHGMSTEQAKAQIEQISQMGASDGLKVDLVNAVPTNTLDAHRLIKLAESTGDRDLTERVIDAFYQVYFSNGESIADHDVLKKVAIEAGLDASQVDEILDSKKFEREVRSDEMEAQQLGIQGAPFFVIDNKYGISGAQPYETFVQALKQVQAKEG
jgi:predicted DsbA family dithiol-disulfide isomerase